MMFRRNKEISLKDINYKNTKFLSRLVSPGGRIIPARITRLNAKEQRQLSEAIKRARFLALMPYVVK
jgi:small subunit ribosomal protein S18